MKLTNFKLALITGASSGIGEALARLLARKKIPLVLVARSQGKLQALANELDVSVQVFPCDLNSRKERLRLVEFIHLQKPDLFINNAGYGLYGEALSYTAEEMLQMIELDVAALTELSLESARALVGAGKPGLILNVSSAAAFLPFFPLFSVYSASKGYVNTFSQSLDEEVRESGVRVLTSCPGMVDTNFRFRASGDHMMKPSGISMPVDVAAKEIWGQIERRKPVHTFNWKFRWLTWLGRILPRSLLAKALKASVKERFPKRKLILRD